MKNYWKFNFRHWNWIRVRTQWLSCHLEDIVLMPTLSLDKLDDIFYKIHFYLDITKYFSIGSVIEVQWHSYFSLNFSFEFFFDSFPFWHFFCSFCTTRSYQTFSLSLEKKQLQAVLYLLRFREKSFIERMKIIFYISQSKLWLWERGGGKWWSE